MFKVIFIYYLHCLQIAPTTFTKNTHFLRLVLACCHPNQRLMQFLTNIAYIALFITHYVQNSVYVLGISISVLGRTLLVAFSAYVHNIKIIALPNFAMHSPLPIKFLFHHRTRPFLTLKNCVTSLHLIFSFCHLRSTIAWMIREKTKL